MRNGLLKEIVAKEGYLLGRSVLNMSVGVVQIGGFAAGGLLVSVLSPRGTLLAAAGLYLAAAAVARFGLTRRAPRSAGRASVAATWRNNAALWSSVPRRYVLLALWVPNGLIVGCESLYVSYSPSGAGLLFAFGAVGMLAGDTLVGRFVPPHLRRRLGAALRLLLAAPTWCSPCTRRSRCDRRRRRRHRRLLGEPAPAGAPDGPDPGRAGRAGPRPAVGGSAHDAGRGGRPRGNGRPVHLGRHRDDRDGGGVPRRHPRAGPGSAHTRRWRHRIRSSMFGRTRTSMLEEHLTFPAFQDGPGKAVAADDGLVRALSDLGTAGSRDGRIAAMDAAGIDVQVLSLTAPGIEQLDGPNAPCASSASSARSSTATVRAATSTSRSSTRSSPGPPARGPGPTAPDTPSGGGGRGLLRAADTRGERGARLGAGTSRRPPTCCAWSWAGSSTGTRRCRWRSATWATRCRS